MMIKSTLRFCLGLIILIVGNNSVVGQRAWGGLVNPGLNLNTQSAGIMTQLAPSTSSVRGNAYISDKWLRGKVELTSGNVIENLLMRYDILDDLVEVKADSMLKGVKGKHVRSMTFLNSAGQLEDAFINARYYQDDGAKLTGFFRVITNGTWSLLEKIEVTLVKPNYNPVLGVGEQDASYVKKSKLYMANGTSVFIVQRNKKKFLNSLNERSNEVSIFIKREKLSLKKVEDIILIVNFLNEKSLKSKG